MRSIAKFFIFALIPTAVSAQQVVTLDTLRTTVSSRAANSLGSAQRTVDVITRQELDQRAGWSISQILATALGVDVTPRSPAQQDISIRGSTIEQVVILVDGVRVNDEQTGHFDLDLAIPVDMIERIEILRGTGSALYGPDAVGGAINIVTRHDRTLSLSRLKTGTFGTKGGALLEADTVKSVGVQAGGDYESSSGQRPGTDYRIIEGRIATNAMIGNGYLAADAAMAARDFGADTFYGPYPSFESTHTSTASVRYDTPMVNGWSLSSDASVRRHIDLFTLERDDPSFYQNHHDNWQLDEQTVARYVASQSVALAFGADALDARLVSPSLGDHDDTHTAAFGELNLGSIRSANLDLGVREDHSSEYGNFTSPSIAGSLPLASDLWLRASAGRGFRAPTWTERFYIDPDNIGDPNLRPETFSTGEVGLRAIPTASTRFDADVYVRKADNLIDWTKLADAPATAPWETMNIESAMYRGVEFTAQFFRVAGADWTIRASGLSFTPTGADGYIGKYALTPLTRSIGGTIALPLSDHLDFMTDLLEARRAEEGGYGRIDARLTYRFTGVRLTLDALNLTSADYLDPSGLPVAGRGFFLGAVWTAR